MRITSAALVCLCFLPSCSAPDLDTFARKHTRPEERAFAQQYLQLLASGQIDSAASMITPGLRTDTLTRTLQRIGTLLHEAHLDSLQLIGVNINDDRGSGSHALNLTYEVPTTNGGWLTTNVATQVVQGHRSIIGLSANRVPARLEEINAFTLMHQSARHYLWFVFALLMPLITLTVAVRLITAKGMPRRWLWAFAALIASPAFVLNWTSGQVAVQNSLFVLFGAAFTRPGAAAPWSLTFAMPVGAVVAYLRYRAWRNARATQAVA